MSDSTYFITEDDRATVRDLAAIGVSEEDIATKIKLPLDVLQDVCHDELTSGAAEGREQVLRSFHKFVQTGNNIAATKFWIESRCGWKETATNPTVKITRDVIVCSVKPDLPRAA